MEALMTALKAKMDGDAGAGKLATLSSGGIYRKKAKKTATPPYTVFTKILTIPGYTFSVEAYRSIFVQITHFAVDANTSGAVSAGTMADRTEVLLTDPALNVTGKTVLSCRFIRSIPEFVEDDGAGRVIDGAGGLFEIWLT